MDGGVTHHIYKQALIGDLQLMFFKTIISPLYCSCRESMLSLILIKGFVNFIVLMGAGPKIQEVTRSTKN